MIKKRIFSIILGTYTDIAELEPNATVLDGIAFSIDDVDDVEKDVSEWLSDLGY